MIEITKAEEQFKTLGLEGWLEPWDLKNIYEQVSRLKSGQTYLEIGVARGKSASMACLAANPGVKLFGIDEINWPDREENIRKFLEMNGRLMPQGWQFIPGDSQLTARYWGQGPIDLLFIDGDHTYEGVIKDMASWLPWMRSGGNIMFDDYNETTGVRRAVNDILMEHQAFSRPFIEGEMFICKKK